MTPEQEDQQTDRCNLGRVEYGGDRYCYTHGGFEWSGGKCDRRLREEAREQVQRELPKRIEREMKRR